MADVFISYSRNNITFARQLFEQLEATERDCWIDWEGIPLSTDWWQQIQSAIEAANAFLLIMTPDSLTSPACMLEVAHAIKHNKRIIPVVREESEIEAVLGRIAAIKIDDVLSDMLAGRDLLIMARDNWRTLGHINWVFVREQDDFSAAFRQLIEAIETDREHVESHTRLLTRANEWNNTNRNSSLLLRGDDLKTAEVWLANARKKTPNPTDLQIEYISASRNNEKHRQRGFLLGVSLALMVTVVLLLIAVWQFAEAQNEANSRATQELIAQHNAQIAETQAARATVAQGEALDQANYAQTQVAIAERNAAESQSLFLSASARQAWNTYDYELAVALALQANSIPDPPLPAQKTLSEIVYAPGIRQQYAGAYAGVFDKERQIVITGSNDGSVRLFDMQTGDEMRRFEAPALAGGQDNFVFAVALSPGGQMVLSGSNDGVVRLWRIDDGLELTRFEEHTDAVQSVGFVRDGDWAVSGASDGTIFVWNLMTGRPIHESRVDDAGVTQIAVAPDGNSFAAGFDDGTIILWDVDSGNEKQRYVAAEVETNRVSSIAFNPDASIFVTGHWSGALVLWNVETSEYQLLNGHEANVSAVTFSSDGQSILSNGWDDTLRVWSIDTGQESQRINHVGWSNDITLDPSGRAALISTATDVRLWELVPGDVVYDIKHEAAVESIVFSPSGQTAFYESGGNVWRFEMSSGTATSFFSVEGDCPVNNVAISSRGDTGLAATACGIWLFDAQTGASLKIYGEDVGDISNVIYGPNNKTFLASTSGAADETSDTLLWDIETGDVIHRYQGHAYEIQDLALGPDGSTFVSSAGFSDEASEIFLWDIASETIIQRFEGHSGYLYGVTFSPDGETVLSGGSDSTLRLWDRFTGREIDRITGHDSPVTTAVFSIDGDYVLSGSTDFSPSDRDNSARIWDIETGKEIHSLQHAAGVFSATYTPDGQAILLGSEDGSLILWQVLPLNELIEWTQTHRLVHEFTCQERQAYRIEPLC